MFAFGGEGSGWRRSKLNTKAYGSQLWCVPAVWLVFQAEIVAVHIDDGEAFWMDTEPGALPPIPAH